jgi:hypothetical protein
MKQWQHRLFLDDWIINLRLFDPTEMDNEAAGTNEFQIENKSSIIKIANLNDDLKTRNQKACHEKTLVHELLHLKYNIVERSNEYESKFLDIHQHMLLEQMSKSLIMAKYNIDLEWFVNF